MFPIESQASVKEGIWFVFNDENHTIHVWGSLLNGKENVFVDEQIVSEKRSIKQNSEHIFNIDNNEYKIKVSAVNRLMGPLECQLFRNGILKSSYSCKYERGKNAKQYSFLAMMLLIGIVGIPTSFIMNAPVPISLLFITISVVTIVLIRRNGPFKNGEFVFEKTQ